ncbi:MAG TPA: DegT/DnrJ/EryC1/StrS family aminotransferase [Burkholderiales bacterium]|nr:DegT/DnrJ/EryC1/StrS family aminotransferase [Betaproteobacteria bacterium]HQR53201.1 DegT/DnrJ/EryC1/StrS family aminotransferase [Burkholderiales bacterium]
MNTPEAGTSLVAEVEHVALSDPDISTTELDLVAAVLRSPHLSSGNTVAAFEEQFAAYVGRDHGVAVASGTLGAWLGLRALGIGAGDEVIAPAYAWHQIAHAVVLAGATPVLADIDYWSHCVAPKAVVEKIGPATRAIIAGNTNGHPAAWRELTALARARRLALIEDSTEAIGSRYLGRRVGGFGDIAVFDFSQPSALCCGEGGMVVTDDPKLATELRYLRARSLADRRSVSVGSRVPLQTAMSELTAALGLAQLARVVQILERRKRVESWYRDEMQSFEGIKPPYEAPDIDEVHWMLYVVHLGTRFTASARNQIVDDLETQGIETAAFCLPLHRQFAYAERSAARGGLPTTERIADRSLALPFHGHLDAERVKYIVKTLKDASVNVGAGAAIYL